MCVVVVVLAVIAMETSGVRWGPRGRQQRPKCSNSSERKEKREGIKSTYQGITLLLGKTVLRGQKNWPKKDLWTAVRCPIKPMWRENKWSFLSPVGKNLTPVWNTSPFGVTLCWIRTLNYVAAIFWPGARGSKVRYSALLDYGHSPLAHTSGSSEWDSERQVDTSLFLIPPGTTNWFSFLYFPG